MRPRRRGDDDVGVRPDRRKAVGLAGLDPQGGPDEVTLGEGAEDLDPHLPVVDQPAVDDDPVVGGLAPRPVDQPAIGRWMVSRYSSAREPPEAIRYVRVRWVVVASRVTVSSAYRMPFAGSAYRRASRASEICNQGRSTKKATVSFSGIGSGRERKARRRRPRRRRPGPPASTGRWKVGRYMWERSPGSGEDRSAAAAWPRRAGPGGPRLAVGVRAGLQPDGHRGEEVEGEQRRDGDRDVGDGIGLAGVDEQVGRAPLRPRRGDLCARPQRGREGQKRATTR